MKPSELFQFSAQCLTLDEHPDFRESVLTTLQDQKNNDRFIRLCSNHFILPTVFLKFKKHGLLEVWCKDYVKHIENIYQKNKERNITILKQIDELNELLQKENIQPVYLKGTAQLMDGLYNEVGERMIGDIDFLVQDKDYLKTAQILLQQDYRQQTQNFVDINELKHYPRLFKESRPAAVEIHRIPVKKPYSEDLSTSMIFTGCRAAGTRSNCLIPCREHMVLHNFIHSQLADEGYKNKRCILRNIYDLYLLSESVNLQKVAEQTQYKHELQSYFHCAKNLLNTTRWKVTDNQKPVSRYYKQVLFYLDYPIACKSYIRSKRLLYLVFVRYIFRFIRAVFDKRARKYIYRRVSDKSWYSYHLNGLRRLFR